MEERSQRIVVVRHAETEWSRSGRHTGRTDVELTSEGRRKAELIGRALAGRRFDRVLTSPLRRARDTCEIAGFAEEAEVRPELSEWDYGDYEGRTTSEILDEVAQWSLWVDGAPGGESPADVAERVRPLIEELRPMSGDALVFSHGHLSRMFAVQWAGLANDAGRGLALDTGSISVLGWHHDEPVIVLWNDRHHLHGGQA